MCVLHIFLHSLLKWRRRSKTTRKRQKKWVQNNIQHSSNNGHVATGNGVFLYGMQQIFIFALEWAIDTDFYGFKWRLGDSLKWRKRRKISPGYHINNVGGRKGKLSYADENAIIISYYRWIELLLIWLSECMGERSEREQDCTTEKKI